MSNPAKDLRKQLRNVVQELLPLILSAEVNQNQFNQLSKVIDSRLTSLEKQVKDTLHEINERHKDTMSYLARSVTTTTDTIPQYVKMLAEESLLKQQSSKASDVILEQI